MEYDKEELEQLSLKAIQENNLVDFKEISLFVPPCRATLYNHGLDKLDTIKEALNDNKISTKVKLRKKWFESDNATLQLALMKLISEDDERKKLSQTYQDHTTDGKPIIEKLDYSKLSKEALNEIAGLADKPNESEG